MQSYAEFLDLSVGFPQDGFDIIDDELYFHDLNLMEMIETYGSPLRFTYLPIISKKIQQAKLLFQAAIVKNNYRGGYKYCYCTKSSHFRHIVEEALRNDIHLETSSAFDIPFFVFNMSLFPVVKVFCVCYCRLLLNKSFGVYWKYLKLGM
jgi:arginine decarboxylase